MDKGQMNLLQNVLIYSGPGTCPLSVQQTLKTFKNLLSHVYDVKLVDLETLRNKNIRWDCNCKLLVMPGGRDSYYDAHFRENSIAERIKSAVNSGKMKYFGICAGAYFATDCVEFEVGRKGYEVIGDRPLKLTSCTAKGTIYPFKYSEFEAQNESSFKAVEIQKADGSILKSLYIGGCYFEGAVSEISFANYSVNAKPAIIATDSFVLSGVHLEFHAVDCLSCLSKPAEKAVMTSLLPFETQRKALLVSLLTGLGLRVKLDSNYLPSEFIIYSSGIRPSSTGSLLFKSIEQAGPFNFLEFQRQLPSAIEKLNFWYAPIITSTQIVLLDHPQWVESLPNFSVLLADHQVRGRGRGSNSWISSPACLQFTLLLKHPSDRSAMLPMIQYLMAISVAETANSQLNSSQQFKARIKWPNDVYLCSANHVIGKISGILVQAVNSLVAPKIQNVFVGTGVNVESDPSLANVVHLNDYASAKITKEAFLAECLGRFEQLYSDYLQSGKFPFASYYKNWLHSEERVTFEGEQVTIKGIDEFGYLRVENSSGASFLLEPDGNSFDMMNNLLKRK